MNLIKKKKNSGKPVRPLFGPQFCCYCLKYKKKTNKPNLRKCPKKLISAPILVHVTQIWTPKLFSWVFLPLDVRHCLGLSSYAISKKTYDPNSRKWQRNTFWPNLCPLVPNSVDSSFFSIFWLYKSIYIIISYHFVQYQENLMIQSWENLVTDGQTGRQTDGQRQTDWNDFIGCCRASSVQ